MEHPRVQRVWLSKPKINVCKQASYPQAFALASFHVLHLQAFMLFFFKSLSHLCIHILPTWYPLTLQVSAMFVFSGLLRQSDTATITKTISITTQRERILLVEMLHAEYAYGHSTNWGRALLTFSLSFSLLRPVWPGLYGAWFCFLHMVATQRSHSMGHQVGSVVSFPAFHFCRPGSNPTLDPKPSVLVGFLDQYWCSFFLSSCHLNAGAKKW